jgi:allophanate hydrolase subunit 1
MHIAPAGDRALLVTLGEVSAEELHGRAAALRALPGVIACVPGHSSLLVVFDGPPNLDRDVLDRPIDAGGRGRPPLHRIPVQFDGVDLAEFLALHGLTRDEFLARVATLRLTARYLGFRGGFAYLDGWPREWAMPRRPTSRPVARGSFAIAGEVAGFYPIDTPGGWNVLGRAGEDVEDRFAPGDEIYVTPSEVEGSGRRPAFHTAGSLDFARDDMELLFGPLVTPIVGSRAPFDDVADAIVRNAVTNPLVLECPLTAPRIRYRRKKTVAWFDGELRVEQLEGEHTFGRVQHGLRGYLAIGDEPTNQPANQPTRSDRHLIRAIAGPHDIGLRELACDVTPKLDRVGIRLEPLQRIDVAAPADLESCGMLCGTMQLHPDGSVVVMGPDHPVTGGYLMPMTVISSERWKLAQLAPGERVTFVADQPPYW